MTIGGLDRAIPTHVDKVKLELLRDVATDMLSLRVSGSCMAPELADGSQVRVNRRAVYWPGDIIVFRNREGALLAHRFLGYYRRSGEWRMLTSADNAKRPDGYVRSDQVVGRVNSPSPGLAQRFKSLGRMVHYAVLRIFSGASLA